MHNVDIRQTVSALGIVGYFVDILTKLLFGIMVLVFDNAQWFGLALRI